MESEAKKCAVEKCRRTAKPGQKYCYDCNQQARYEMKKAGYLSAVVSPTTAKALQRHGWNGIDG
jgi:uncharacterized OB-fold protein